MLHGANFDKMLEVDPQSCAQAFKGSSSVNHAPPMAEDKASTQGPGALAGLKVIDLTRVLGGPYCTMVLSDHGAPSGGRAGGRYESRCPFQWHRSASSGRR